MKIRRWTGPGSAEPGIAAYDVAAPPGLDARLLLAAHVKVLSVITSQREVITGYRPGTDLRRCQLTLPDGSWQQLIAAAAAAVAPTDAVPDALLDLSGQPRPTAVLCTSYDRDTGRLELRCRRSVMNADFVRRLAGYYLRTLELMTAEPHARHGESSLVSDDELATQLLALAGPTAPLPDTSVIGLFEQQVRRQPGDIAAIHGQRRWSYAEVNDRANRVALSLLRRGLRREDVVAVMMDRGLDWLAAVLGVLKAGGVYLPIRPDFPAERVATQLDRSACRFAVVDADTDLGVTTVHCAQAYAENGGPDPELHLGPEQLAYIYFTSGSTGAPKGAMCEHAGMLNHMLAKIEDMGLTAGDAVTQTASACFDISLWQLVAPLLVGGRTVIVDTETQLEVEKFVDLLASGGIQVIQVVPSYLDVLLTHLERSARPLGDLRTVSVTGEALKLELVRRWFARCPGISLVNAYGATEVSDDTMHEILDGVPIRDFVTVGRSLRNVRTYVLDERLRPVPLGAPGEICFSGVSVGRGYINDPDRTRQAFVADPFQPGTRMYRTGDFGRWLPEGRIEFLGRRDQQVKIRGFRIEIGEVESRLLRMNGVKDGAVVIDERPDGAKHLVAFYTGAEELAAGEVPDFLATSLPDYMVPSYVHRLDALPLNENGKVDKLALTAMAGRLSERRTAYAAPVTETERRLATAWAEVLNVVAGRISRTDDFFQIGGTSLAAVRLMLKLDCAISLRDLVAQPVLGDLAAFTDRIDSQTTTAATALLQPLSTVDGGARAAVVCFPYAAGNAVNFQKLAGELNGDRIAVYGVELPGHDLAHAGESLAEVGEIADRVCQEILATVRPPVLLWGHCAGVAFALAVARLLEAAGQRPQRVFAGAMMLDDPATLAAENAAVTALTAQQLTARLHQESAYVQLDGRQTERADVVGLAYRHDVCSTNRHFIAVQADPDGHRLSTPLTVVVATNDETTAGYPDRYQCWQRVTSSLDLHEIAGGGHYFIRTRPAEASAVIRAACP